jgi:tetratricopeptide (TPR) repeat protein
MLRKLGRVVRARPKTVLVLTLVLLFGTLIGFYGYALHQWHAAQEAVKQGRPSEARQSLDLCLFVWPHSTQVHLLAARTAWLTWHFEEAEIHLQKCLKLQNGATPAIQLEFLLMRVLMGEEDEVADSLFQYVDNKHPDSSLIMETLARAYMHQFRYDKAYRCLNRWITEVPDATKAYHWRGWIQERLNNHQEAMADYRQALELDPDLVPVRLRVAEMLLDLNRPLESLVHLERLSRQCPERADVMARLGHCRFLQGRPEEARRLLEAAVIKLPDDPPLLLYLAKLELQDSKPAQAEKLLRRALKADPSDTIALFTLASTLQLLGRKEEAAEALNLHKKHTSLLKRTDQLLQDEARHPTKDPNPATEVGILLLNIGQERQGLYWLDQALFRDPGHLPAHKALAEYFENKGQLDRAAPHRRWLRPATKNVSR